MLVGRTGGWGAVERADVGERSTPGFMALTSGIAGGWRCPFQRWGDNRRTVVGAGGSISIKHPGEMLRRQGDL